MTLPWNFPSSHRISIWYFFEISYAVQICKNIITYAYYFEISYRYSYIMSYEYCHRIFWWYKFYIIVYSINTMFFMKKISLLDPIDVISPFRMFHNSLWIFLNSQIICPLPALEPATSALAMQPLNHSATMTPNSNEKFEFLWCEDVERMFAKDI